MKEDGVQGCSVGGTPLLSGDVEEDGVQAAVLGVLLYGVETWKRMVYRLQCWGYSSMERRCGRGWCTGRAAVLGVLKRMVYREGCSVGGTKEDGVQGCSVGVLLYGAETWKRMVYRAAVLGILLYGAET